MRNYLRNQTISLLLLSGIAAAAEPYTYLWWADGWRGKSAEGKKVMMVQTNTYGAAFDVERAALLHLGALENALSYLEGGRQPNRVVTGLPAASLQISAHLDGVEYTCVSAAGQQEDMANYPIRIIESGRVLQRFDVLHLLFENAQGEHLQAAGRLEVVAWPDRLHVILDVTAEGALEAASFSISLEQEGHAALQRASDARTYAEGEIGSVSLVWSPLPDRAAEAPLVVRAADIREPEQPLSVSLDASRGWWYVDLPERQWDIAAEPDRLDRFKLFLENPTEQPQIFRLLFAFDDAFTGVTGMSPMLRDAEGNPTGIPVQISKNWHRLPDRRFLYEGPWFHGFSVITLEAGARWEGELAIAYGRWGGVPAVSHAQLSLVGWGTNQLWEQVAIGSWGESICYDPDVNLNRSMIDDIRPLMVTGMNGGQWTWTHNVGGGDFLVYFDAAGKKQFLTRMKTAHLAYGPNLTEAVYSGVSADGKIAASIHVSTPRGDDLNRAYHRVRYDVLSPTPFSRLAFYQLGADGYNDHQFTHIARGNAAGIQEEWETGRGGKRYLRGAMPLEGDAPWLSLHGGLRPENLTEGAWANRGLVLRSWKARLGGQDAPTAHAAVYGTENGPHSANVELVPPPGLTELQRGDFVEAEVELLILPQNAADYYGPSKRFHEQLARHAGTAGLVHTLAAENDVRVQVEAGGTVLRRLPVVIRADTGETIAFKVSRAMGYLPVTFSGLTSHKGYVLFQDGVRVDQAVHGGDFWQTIREEAGTYALTFNVPVPVDASTRLELRHSP